MTTGPGALALFGGSFDPPHLAHLALAALARDTLDAPVRWLPAGQPWQKAGRRLADGAHRAAMVQRLIDGQPRMALDRRELDREGPTYTIDTVRELAAEHPGTPLWLVIGQDQYARLHTWHQAPALLQAAGLAVAARDGVAPAVPPELAALPHRLRVLPLPAMPISATDVRHRVAGGLPVSPMVGDAVAGYIDLHHLYRD